MASLVFGLKARLRESKPSTSYSEPAEDEFIDPELETLKAAVKSKAPKKPYKAPTKEEKQRAREKKKQIEDAFNPNAAQQQKKKKQAEKAARDLQRKIAQRVEERTSRAVVPFSSTLSPQRLLSLPRELLDLVFGHLGVTDLVNIEKANETAESPIVIDDAVWHKAYVAAGLPVLDDDDDMCERDVIELLFDKSCHGCDAENHTVKDFGARLRLCQDCYKSKDLYALRSKLDQIKPALHPLAVECTPSSTVRYGKYRRRWSADERENAYYVEDLQAASKELKKLQAKDDRKLGRVKQPVVRKKKGRKAVVPALPEPGPFVEEYLEEQKELVKVYAESAVTLKTAYNAYLQREKDDANAVEIAKEKIREANWQFVEEKVAALGFDVEYTRWMQSRQDPLVQAPVPITEEDWEEHKDRFIDAFEKTAKREAQRTAVSEKYGLHQQRIDSLVSAYEELILANPPSADLPGFIPFLDFCSLPSLWKLIQDDTSDAETIDTCAVKKLAGPLLVEIAEWREKATFLHIAARIHTFKGAVMPKEWLPTSSYYYKYRTPTPTNLFALPDDHDTVFDLAVYNEDFFAHPLFTPESREVYTDPTAIAEALAEPWDRRHQVWTPTAVHDTCQTNALRKVLEAANVEDDDDGPDARAKIAAMGATFRVYKEVRTYWSLSFTIDHGGHSLMSFDEAVSFFRRNRYTGWKVKVERTEGKKYFDDDSDSDSDDWSSRNRFVRIKGRSGKVKVGHSSESDDDDDDEPPVKKAKVAVTVKTEVEDD